MVVAAQEPATAAAEYLERVEAILGPVAAAAPEIEGARQLPGPIAELLRAAGMFAVAVPRSWGGLELDPLTQARGIELLATADASASWCAMIGCDTGYVSAFLDDSIGRGLFTDPTRATAVVLNPTGTAKPVAGGYAVSGRWTFASGCTHAPVFALGCLAMTDSGPRMLAGGGPEIRVCVMPAEQAQVIDTWTTTGVRGSGSNDIAVTDRFVPEEQTFSMEGADLKRSGPLYRWSSLYVCKTGAVPLGIARGAIDDVIAIAQNKRPLGSMAPLVEQSWFHTAIANAETRLGQARSFYYDAFADVWAPLLVGELPTLKSRARLHLSICGALENSTAVVDAMYRAAGSSALYAPATLDRRLRDIHTIGQHVVFGPGAFATSGKAMLGLPVPEARLLQD